MVLRGLAIFRSSSLPVCRGTHINKGLTCVRFTEFDVIDTKKDEVQERDVARERTKEKRCSWEAI
jgi:hypothetical protein